MGTSEGSSSPDAWHEGDHVSHPAGGAHADTITGEGSQRSGDEDTSRPSTNENVSQDMRRTGPSDSGTGPAGGSSFSDHSGSVEDDDSGNLGERDSDVPTGPDLVATRLVEWGVKLPDARSYHAMDLNGQVRTLITAFRGFLQETQRRPGGPQSLPNSEERRIFLHSNFEYAERFHRIQECLRSHLPQTFGPNRGRVADTVEGFVFAADNILRRTDRDRPGRHRTSGSDELRPPGE